MIRRFVLLIFKYNVLEKERVAVEQDFRQDSLGVLF